MRKFSWGTQRYFMSWKWKSVTGELYDISYHEVEKIKLEISTIFHFNEVEKFNRKSLRYFMSTKWKSLIEELYDISCPRSGNV